jgi:hypothetical protein
MSYFMVDVEADGPCPGLYSMVSFGAILVRPGLDVTFHGRVRPVSERFIPASQVHLGYADRTLSRDQRTSRNASTFDASPRRATV